MKSRFALVDLSLPPSVVWLVNLLCGTLGEKNEKEDKEIEVKLVELRKLRLAQQLSLLGTGPTYLLSLQIEEEEPEQEKCFPFVLWLEVRLDSKRMDEIIEMEKERREQQEATQKMIENDQV